MKLRAYLDRLSVAELRAWCSDLGLVVPASVGRHGLANTLVLYHRDVQEIDWPATQ